MSPDRQLYAYDTLPLKGIVVDEVSSEPSSCRVVETVKTSQDRFFRLLVEMDYAIELPAIQNSNADQKFTASIRMKLKPAMSVVEEVFASGKADLDLYRIGGQFHIVYGHEKGFTLDIVEASVDIGDALNILREMFLGVQVRICQSVFRNGKIVDDDIKDSISTTDGLMKLVAESHHLRLLENVNCVNFHEEDEGDAC